MINALKKVVDKQPQENRRYIEGQVAVDVLESLPERLSKIFTEYIVGIPNDDFKFLGFEYIKPEEELVEDAYTGSTNKLREINKSTVYMVKFLFEFRGELIPKFMYLPYLERGGVMYMSGSPYYIIPVVTDVVISAENNKLLIRLNKDKIRASTISISVGVTQKTDDGILTSLTDLELLLSKPMMPSANKLRMSKDMSYIYPMLYSVIYRYGMSHVLKKLTRFTKDNYKMFLDDDMHTQELKLADEGWTVYRSNYIDTIRRPKLVSKHSSYMPHLIKIAVKDLELSFTEINLIATIINLLDIVNDDTGEHWLDSIDTDYEQLSFQTLISKYLYLDEVSLAKKMSDVAELMRNFETYIDSVLEERLKMSGIKVKDFFELSEYVISNYKDIVASSLTYAAKNDNIYFEYVYYIVHDIQNKYHMFIKKLGQEIRTKNVGLKEVKSMLNKQLTIKETFKLVKSSSRSLVTLAADTHGDAIYFKGTCMLEHQSRGNGAKHGGRNTFPAHTRVLKPLDCVYGTFLNLPKHSPSPVFRWNFYSMITDMGKILIPVKLEKTLKKCEKILSATKEVPDDLYEIISERNNDGEKN